MFRKENNTLLNTSVVIIVSVLVFYILIIGASLLIPFVIALLFSFAIIGLSNFFTKLKIPSFISFILSLATYIFIFWLIGKMIGSNIDDLILLLPEYQAKVSNIISQIFNFFHIPEPTSLSQILNKIDLQYIFKLVIGEITNIFSSTGIILFYVLFILLEYRYFKEKLNLMIGKNINKNHIFETIDKIKRDIKTYFVIKTIVSFITALLSYILMISLGLDLSLFWAILIFILNYIPSIGSIIAITFPSLFSLVQFEAYYTFIFITSGLISIQVLMGNIIEPKFMGNKLNLSPLVIIISLSFWGTVWGVIGMLLSVPIMVIINIVLAKIPVTRNIAILLSEKGELQVDGGEEVVRTRKKIMSKVKDKFKKTR